MTFAGATVAGSNEFSISTNCNGSVGPKGNVQSGSFCSDRETLLPTCDCLGTAYMSVQLLSRVRHRAPFPERKCREVGARTVPCLQRFATTMKPDLQPVGFSGFCSGTGPLLISSDDRS